MFWVLSFGGTDGPRFRREREDKINLRSFYGTGSITHVLRLAVRCVSTAVESDRPVVGGNFPKIWSRFHFWEHGASNALVLIRDRKTVRLISGGFLKKAPDLMTIRFGRGKFGIGMAHVTIFNDGKGRDSNRSEPFQHHVTGQSFP